MQEFWRLFFDALKQNETAFIQFVMLFPFLFGLLLLFRFIVRPAMSLFREVVVGHKELVEEIHKLRYSVIDLERSNRSLENAVQALEKHCKVTLGETADGKTNSA